MKYIDLLKPCPFCGNIPEIADYGDDGYMVVCNICECMTRFFKRKIDCVNIWNTRKNNWISVKNMLPDYNQEVYCYDNLLKQRFEAIYQNGFYTIELKLKLDATHWQPLPAPPEEK